MTRPGDFTDTGVGQTLSAAAKLPWEQPVREVSLAARADTVSDMATVWHTFLTHIGTIADQLSTIWNKDLADYWSGDAATACQGRWNAMLGMFSQFIDNYGTAGAAGTGVPGILSDTATAIHDAIGAIPIPVFGSSTENSASVAVLPNNRGVSRTGGTNWGDELYADYQAGPGSYSDGAFLARALAGISGQHHQATYGDVPAGSRLRSDPHGQYEVGDTSRQVTANYGARQDHTYEATVRAWYTTNQRLAYTAYNNLLNTYAKHQTSTPGPMPWGTRDPGSTSTTPPRWTGPTSTDATAAGAPFAGVAGTGATSTFPGVTHPGAALPAPGNSPVPGTAPGSSSGLSGIGTSAPVGASDQGLGPAIGSNFGTGSGSGFSDDGGGIGAVPVAGFSPAPGTLPGEGAGAIPEALGRTGSDPGIGAEGAAYPRNPAGSSGMGMMGPGYGGAGGRERDESRSWLTEDQDIWGLGDDRDLPEGII